MQVGVYNLQGESFEQVVLPERIFSVPFNMSLVHQAVVTEQANARSPIAHTKTRGEVSGGGKKPWKQKGTGRARAGSIRSPIWRGGGITFGPRSNRNFKKALNRKQFRMALFSVLSKRLSENKLFVIEDLRIEKIGTKNALLLIRALREALQLSAKFNLVIPAADKHLHYSLRNVPGISVLKVSEITPYSILARPATLLFKSAVPAIEKMYAKL